MKQNKIILEDIQCHVNAKAAMVEQIVEEVPDAVEKFLNQIKKSERLGDVFEVKMAKNGVVAMTAEWTEETRENIYDAVIKEKILKKMKTCSHEEKIFLEPVIQMNHKDIKVDTIPFLVYATVKNEKCRKQLEECIKENVQRYLDTFRKSVYCDVPYMKWFQLEERWLVKAAIGYLLELREERGDCKTYTDVISAGYKPLKNVIKRLPYLEGDQFRNCMKNEDPMETNLCRMVVMMAIAADLEIALNEDYDYYLVLSMFKRYEAMWLRDEKNSVLSEGGGKKNYRKLLKEHPHPECYYSSEYLENLDLKNCKKTDEIASLFRLFGMEIRMLIGMSLKPEEVEYICTLFDKVNWDTYKYLILIASLCNYIRKVEKMYEEQIPEEIHYQQTCKNELEENIIQELKNKNKNLEERAVLLEQQKKGLQEKLSQAEYRVNKLERVNKEEEEQHEKEKGELIALRNFIFQMEKAEEGEEKNEQEGWEQLQLPGEMLVIGGHIKWQKKIRAYLPGSQFIAPDHTSFDEAILHNKKYIIFNTDILKHGVYYKIMSEKKEGQKILYVHGSNVGRTLSEIKAQL